MTLPSPLTIFPNVGMLLYLFQHFARSTTRFKIPLVLGRRKLSFSVMLFGIIFLLCRVWNGGSIIKEQRTIDFLRGAAVNLNRFDVPNNTAQFPSINSQMCLIAKNGHSAVQYVSCLLAAVQKNDYEAQENLRKVSTFHGAFSAACEPLRPVWAKENEASKKFVIIRDPLERFVSGWLFVCMRHNVCLDCGYDLSCFLMTLLNCWRTNMQYSDVCTFNPPTVPRNFVFFHMSPQALHCNLRKERILKNHTIIKYSRESINRFLLRAAKPVLSKERHDHLMQLLNQPADHASPKEELENHKNSIATNKELAKMFFALYFIDYDTLGIELPQFIIDFELFLPEFELI